MALDLDYEGKLRCPRRGSLTPEQCRGHLRERDGEGRRANLDCQLCTVGAHVVAYLTHPSPGHRDGRGRFACPGYGALVDERTCRARRRQRGFGAGGWEFPKCRACDVGQELDPEAPADDGGEGRPKRGRPPSYPGRTSRETLRRPEAQPAELQRSAEPEPPELDVPVTRKAGVPLVETPPRKTPRPRGTTSEGAHETPPTVSPAPEARRGDHLPGGCRNCGRPVYGRRPVRQELGPYCTACRLLVLDAEVKAKRWLVPRAVLGEPADSGARGERAPVAQPASELPARAPSVEPGPPQAPPKSAPVALVPELEVPQVEPAAPSPVASEGEVPELEVPPQPEALAELERWEAEQPAQPAEEPDVKTEKTEKTEKMPECSNCHHRPATPREDRHPPETEGFCTPCRSGWIGGQKRKGTKGRDQTLRGELRRLVVEVMREVLPGELRRALAGKR